MADQLRDVQVSQISPNPRQPRTEFDPAALEELAESIKEHGLIQPLTVVAMADGFELVAGERRWRASQLAGLEKVPCVIKAQVSDRDLLEVAIIENVQRVGLSAADEARAYEQLAIEFSLSNDEIARRVGKSRTTIANLRGLLRLPGAVLDRVGAGDGQIPQGIARTLSQIAKIKGATKDIESLAQRLSKGDLTTYAAEEMQIDLVRKYALNIAATHVQELWSSAAPPVSLDGSEVENDDDGWTGCIPAAKPPPDEIVAERQLHTNLKLVLDRLPAQQARVLALRFGLHDNRPRTRPQIPVMLKVSPQRIHQIECEALSRLKLNPAVIKVYSDFLPSYLFPRNRCDEKSEAFANVDRRCRVVGVAPGRRVVDGWAARPGWRRVADRGAVRPGNCVGSLTCKGM